MARLKSKPKKTTPKPRSTKPRVVKESRARYKTDPHPFTPTDHPHIIKVEGVRGGEPITRHSYISVRIIVEAVTRLHEKPAEILEAHDALSYEELSEALSYYLQHTDEIETYIAEHETAGQRALELSRQYAAEYKKRQKVKAASD